MRRRRADVAHPVPIEAIAELGDAAVAQFDDLAVLVKLWHHIGDRDPAHEHAAQQQRQLDEQNHFNEMQLASFEVEF